MLPHCTLLYSTAAAAARATRIVAATHAARVLGTPSLTGLAAGRCPTRLYSDANANGSKPLRVERELPDPRENRARMAWGFVAFSGIMAASLAVIFNYEKTENPIVANTLYQLRRSEKTTALLGNNIEINGIIPWIYGQLNPVAGKINIRFAIKGDKPGQIGQVRLRADRSNKNQEFMIHEWTLTVGDATVDLLAENSFNLTP